VDEYGAAGMPRKEARRRARLELGGIEPTKEACREVRPFRWMENLARDVQLALRSFQRAPGFMIAIVLTLGLGLGLNAAIAMLANGEVLRSMVVRDPASLVSVRFIDAPSLSVTPETLLRETSAFQDVLAELRVTTSLEGQSAFAAAVSGNYFAMLSPPMVLGRPIHPEDEGRVVVIGESCWRVRFSADPEIVGRGVRVGGFPFEVIGVVGAGFTGFSSPGGRGLWVPLPAWSRLPDAPDGVRPVRLGGRLRQGVTAEQAEAMVTAYAAQAAGETSEPTNRARGSVRSVQDGLSEDVRGSLVALLCVFALTMAIPCANAANLLLARALGRQREIGVRLAMGAGRVRIARQLLTEGFLLALLAALVGVVVAQGAIALALRAWYSMAPPFDVATTPVPPLELDRVVIGYVLAAAILTTAAFAALPALQSSRLNLAGVLRGEVGAVRASRLRNVLVVGQVALCTVFLASAAALLQVTARVVSAAPGVDPAEVFQVQYGSQETTETVAAELEGEPWVQSVAFASGAGPAGHGAIRVEMEGTAASFLQLTGQVSPEYFPLVHRQVVRGRNFSREEALSEAGVVIVSETAAAKFWLGEDAVGKRLTVSDFSGQNRRTITVIGVVRDMFESAMKEARQDVVYLPATMGSPTFRGRPMVRGRGAPEQVRRQLEAVLARTGAADRGARIESSEEEMASYTFGFQAQSWFASALGAVALALTLSGIFAATAFLLGQRTKERGIRMALGATAADAARFVLSYSMRLAVLGLAMGGLLSAVVVKWLSTQVFNGIGGIGNHDWTAYGAVGAVIALAAILAALVPALRAARVQPATTLRAE